MPFNIIIFYHFDDRQRTISRSIPIIPFPIPRVCHFYYLSHQRFTILAETYPDGNKRVFARVGFLGFTHDVLHCQRQKQIA